MLRSANWQTERETIKDLTGQISDALAGNSAVGITWHKAFSAVAHAAQGIVLSPPSRNFHEQRNRSLAPSSIDFLFSRAWRGACRLLASERRAEIHALSVFGAFNTGHRTCGAQRRERIFRRGKTDARSFYNRRNGGAGEQSLTALPGAYCSSAGQLWESRTMLRL